MKHSNETNSELTIQLKRDSQLCFRWTCGLAQAVGGRVSSRGDSAKVGGSCCQGPVHHNLDGVGPGAGSVALEVDT